MKTEKQIKERHKKLTHLLNKKKEDLTNQWKIEDKIKTINDIARLEEKVDLLEWVLKNK